jgi:hypothetical protein
MIGIKKMNNKKENITLLDKINYIHNPNLLPIRAYTRKNFAKTYIYQTTKKDSKIKELRIYSQDFTPLEALLLRLFTKYVKRLQLKVEKEDIAKIGLVKQELELDYYEMINIEFDNKEKKKYAKKTFLKMLEKFSNINTTVVFEDNENIENRYIKFLDKMTISKTKNGVIYIVLSDTMFLDKKYIKTKKKATNTTEKQQNLLGYLELETTKIKEIEKLKCKVEQTIFSKLVSFLELNNNSNSKNVIYYFTKEEMLNLICIELEEYSKITVKQKAKNKMKKNIRSKYMKALDNLITKKMLNIKKVGNSYELSR